jgi:hypothetical protein
LQRANVTGSVVAERSFARRTETCDTERAASIQRFIDRAWEPGMFGARVGLAQVQQWADAVVHTGPILVFDANDARVFTTRWIANRSGFLLVG